LKKTGSARIRGRALGQVAEELKIDYDFTTVNSAREMVEAVQNQKADAAVGALSITSDREAVIDFSQPFYESGLQIVVANNSGLTDVIWSMFRNLFTWQLVEGSPWRS